jgi:predicted dehydrogenase
MTRELRVAVAGFGKMGMLHAALLNVLPEIELCAVAEPHPLVRRFARRLLPRARFYADVGRVLEREVPDAVFVTTPTGLHAPLCEAVLQAGSALFVEKPLAADSASCREIVRLAEERPVPTMVGYSKRFAPTYQLARRRLREGAIGQLTSFEGSVLVSQIFSRAEGWRYRRAGSGGGVLAVLGCHLVDMVRWCLSEIEVSDGRATSIYSAEVEDEFTAEVRLSSGAQGRLECSWSRPGYRIPELKLLARGERGSLEVTDDYLRTTLDGQAATLYKQQLLAPVPIDVGGPEYTVEDQSFIASLRQRRATEIPVAEGYRTQVAVDRLYESATFARRPEP